MKLFKHWARGEIEDPALKWPVRAYGGSNTSVEDAVRAALEKARAVASAIRMGQRPDSYSYGDRPMREEIIAEVSDESGRIAAMTRNNAGCLILNTERVLFADIDQGPTRPFSLRESFRALLGKGPSQDDRLSEHVRTVLEDRGLSGRLYRTAAGYRLLITNRLFEPASDETRELLDALGSDPLYVKLCRHQESFRARVSAKPWRCGAPRPPHRFPFATTEEADAYSVWENQYHIKADRHAVCRLIADFGTAQIDPAAERIVAIHDEAACEADRRLA